MARNRTTYLSKTIPVFASLVFDAIFYWRLGYGPKDGQNRVGGLFFALMGLLFSGISSMIISFNENTELLIKEMEQGLYSPLSYYISVSVANFPWNLCSALLLSIPMFFINNMNFEHWYNLTNWAFITIVGCIVADAWGVFLSCWGGTKEKSIVLLSAVTQPLSLFAGFYIADGSVPLVLMPLKFISFFRYIYLAMIKNEFTDINGCDFPIEKDNLCKNVERLNATWEVYQYMLVTLGIALLFKIIGYYIFKARMSKYYK